MRLTTNNFLSQIKNLITGGGTRNGGVAHDAGFRKRAEGVSLSSILPAANLTPTAATLTVTDGAGTNDNTIGAITADASVIAAVQELADEINKLVADVAALKNAAAGVADETNALVLKVEETNDTVGTLRWAVPMDYDENTDSLRVRVLASMVSVTTDTDVELDATVFVKTAGTALGADLDPTAPGTILSATEQWIEFNLDGNSLDRDDLVFFTLITNGANDTNGEEVLIHDIEFVYRSTLVSYDKEVSGVSLR